MTEQNSAATTRRLRSMYGISGFTWPQMVSLLVAITFVIGVAVGFALAGGLD